MAIILSMTTNIIYSHGRIVAENSDHQAKTRGVKVHPKFFNFLVKRIGTGVIDFEVDQNNFLLSKGSCYKLVQEIFDGDLDRPSYLNRSRTSISVDVQAAFNRVFSEAEYKLREKAKKMDPEAQYLLATGLISSQDSRQYNAAVKWLKIAYQNGHEPSALLLAKIFVGKHPDVSCSNREKAGIVILYSNLLRKNAEAYEILGDLYKEQHPALLFRRDKVNWNESALLNYEESLHLYGETHARKPFVKFKIECLENSF
jgi:TPR repeat protein